MTEHAFTDIGAGFADPVFDSQRSFRAVLQAMSRPGTVVMLPPFGTAPAGIRPAAAAVVLTLVDFDTVLWLDPAAQHAGGYFRFHCGCRLADEPGDADFALIADPVGMPRLAEFKSGSDDFPDRSATVILQIDEFAGSAARFRGPGIADCIDFAVRPLPTEFAAQWRDNTALYPRGIDLILAADAAMAALPRSSRMEG